jgi:hypothetical protein
MNAMKGYYSEQEKTADMAKKDTGLFREKHMK